MTKKNIYLSEDELVNLTIEILKEKGIEAKPENDITDRDVVYQIYKYFSKLGQMSNKSYLDGENFNISAKEILKLDPVTLGSFVTACSTAAINKN